MPNHFNPDAFQHYATVGVFLAILVGTMQVINVSPEETETKTDDPAMVAFIRVIYMCGLAWAIETILRMRRIDYAAIFSYIALLLLTLAMVLLAFILIPADAPFALALWFIFLSVVAREMYMQHSQSFWDAVSQIKNKFTTLLAPISHFINGAETPPPPPIDAAI